MNSGTMRAAAGDQAWLGSRVIAGLSTGGIAHLCPAAMTIALTAVITLVARNPRRAPARRRAARERRRGASGDRRAPAKTVLAVSP